MFYLISSLLFAFFFSENATRGYIVRSGPCFYWGKQLMYFSDGVSPTPSSPTPTAFILLQFRWQLPHINQIDHSSFFISMFSDCHQIWSSQQSNKASTTTMQKNRTTPHIHSHRVLSKDDTTMTTITKLPSHSANYLLPNQRETEDHEQEHCLHPGQA